MRILIIDDEEHIQRIFAAFLLRYGQDHQVRIESRAARDPVQAMQELTSNGNNYDLILLDLRMPKLSGCEICRAIARDHPQLLSRVLFITGYPEDLIKDSPGEPDTKLNILEKPFRYKQLAAKINAISSTRPSMATA